MFDVCNVIFFIFSEMRLCVLKIVLAAAAAAAALDLI
jgi:hypothetical protein